MKLLHMCFKEQETGGIMEYPREAGNSESYFICCFFKKLGK